jgi:hypothetical protein
MEYFSHQIIITIVCFKISFTPNSPHIYIQLNYFLCIRYSIRFKREASLQNRKENNKQTLSYYVSIWVSLSFYVYFFIVFLFHYTSKKNQNALHFFPYITTYIAVVNLKKNITKKLFLIKLIEKQEMKQKISGNRSCDAN